MAADDQLTDAIAATRAAYWPDTRDRLLSDYVVVFADQGYDDEGDVDTAVGRLVRDGSLAGYRIAGLLDTARAMHHRDRDSE